MKLKALAAGIGLALASTMVQAEEQKPNIIYIIGDGMGFEYISAYRYAMSDLDSKTIAETEFDAMLKGAATTYPDDNTWVTDSAAGATALATGVKSYNGAIAVDSDKYPLQSIMELARENGWSTGSVSTSQVNHATPASFFTHHPSRYEYNQIADKIATQVVEGKPSFDVMLGGGQSYFNRDDKNWLDVLPEHGMQVVTDMQKLNSVDSTPVMGLFAEKGLPFAIDGDVDALANMTRTALRLLDKKQQPFALMIEGSEIDWCGHANDIACAVHEMDGLNRALKVVSEYRENNPNTLIVMTADHSTGGLTLGRDGEYAWHSDRVMKIKSSIASMSKEMLTMDTDSWAEYVADKVNFELTQEYLDELAIAAEKEGEEQQEALHQALVYITGDITGTGWTTSGHTGVDVPVFADGPYSENFGGYMDNTDIGKQLIKVVK
ncbi:MULTISPECIES: alkaline phosphatase [Idiomarina]|jgi:alkaline phosphatase|uniref:Alkaline phosphatase n=1 Tax=Idiomarina loihiensis (strain ATCC BAA-735 / DSM 15497 / L2-TR) TaxID=283942 RepID=Q5QY92_IDILO|nr:MULTISPECIES: alkaline phosphatase [Idiomarina]AAV82843.1 Alkaline phosphatase [Idiomarina loihiensis L2TR]AGM36886.1 alkaline phosphatase [Idiomarina loihiensis GSL 199]NWO03527.1 alkaline phosphatase [Idiomarinaceae bacterium]|tara:strand:- start:17705 stop:19012 length:1308 start_codon:yes stop_codon:yes gene_type:complete